MTKNTSYNTTTKEKYKLNILVQGKLKLTQY